MESERKLGVISRNHMDMTPCIMFKHSVEPENYIGIDLIQSVLSFNPRIKIVKNSPEEFKGLIHSLGLDNEFDEFMLKMTLLRG